MGNGLERRGEDALRDLAGATGGVAYFPDTLDQVDTLLERAESGRVADLHGLGHATRVNQRHLHPGR